MSTIISLTFDLFEVKPEERHWQYVCKKLLGALEEARAAPCPVLGSAPVIMLLENWYQVAFVFISRDASCQARHVINDDDDKTGSIKKNEIRYREYH